MPDVRSVHALRAAVTVLLLLVTAACGSVTATGLLVLADAVGGFDRWGDLVRDLFLTGSGARAEHYEIAAYSGLITSAKALGESEVVTLLEENLRQEEAALGKLESIAQRLAQGAKKPAAAR